MVQHRKSGRVQNKNHDPGQEFQRVGKHHPFNAPDRLSRLVRAPGSSGTTSMQRQLLKLVLWLMPTVLRIAATNHAPNSI
jgi:hypothetical protein